MKTSKICALLSPRKMAPKEQCNVPLLKVESQQTKSQRQQGRLPRLMDPQFGYLIPKNPSGDLSAGTL
jgi:hypothetical protein